MIIYEQFHLGFKFSYLMIIYEQSLLGFKFSYLILIVLFAHSYIISNTVNDKTILLPNN